jgi:DNA-binding transcriptional LysR family regulator
MRAAGPKIDHLDWDDLRTALFLARAGSVRKAARGLGVSHSTVLRRLEALESSTGVRLFERKPDGYELTPAGQDVFDTAGALEEIVAGLERRVEGRDLRLAGAVRVTLPDPFLALLLPPLRELGAAQPDINVTVAVDVGYADLAHREADIAVRVASEPPPDLVGRRLVTAGVGVYGSEDYLRRRKTKDLGALDWVGWESDSQMAFERWRAKSFPEARVTLRASTAWAIRDAVDAGLGVSIFPCALGGTRPGWRCLRRIPEASAPLWVLTHADLRTTARVRLVRDALTDAMLAQRAVIEGRDKADPRARAASGCGVGRASNARPPRPRRATSPRP